MKGCLFSTKILNIFRFVALIPDLADTDFVNLVLTFVFVILLTLAGMSGRGVEERVLVDDVDEVNFILAEQSNYMSLLILLLIIVVIMFDDQVDFSLREHTERSKAVWSTASFQLKLVNIYDEDENGDDHGDDGENIDHDHDHDDAHVATR